MLRYASAHRGIDAASVEESVRGIRGDSSEGFIACIINRSNVREMNVGERRWPLAKTARFVGGCILALCLHSTSALAADVALAGVFGQRAVIVVDGGAPLTMKVGQRLNGIRLVSVEGDLAVVEVEGGQIAIRLGERVVQRGMSANSHVLYGDGQGHFRPQGHINGKPVGFLVDTGASLVSMGISDARRLGLDLTQARKGRTQTANGVVDVYRVMLDSVQLGPLLVYNIEASVHEHDLPVVLLGMSFLSRMDMSHEGNRMTLRKRY